MTRARTFSGVTGPVRYLLFAPIIMFSQHLLVFALFRVLKAPLAADGTFWLLPLRRLASIPDLPARVASLAFAYTLLCAWALAVLSYRRARWSQGGFALAAFSFVPGIQFAAVAILAALPRLRGSTEVEIESGVDLVHVVQGVLSGVSIIVVAVLVSALTFGSYGWGLFVLTPLLVGLTTGYLANRRQLLTGWQTGGAVIAAAALGSFALIMFALEGLVCIIMAAPLGLLAALLGGAGGRTLARARQSHETPLMSVALLPAIFALEAAMPPMIPIASHASVDIAAPSAAVWAALTSDAPIANGPGIIGLSGLAFPVRGRLTGSGLGATRLGYFSTGVAREQVTEWVPGRQLAFSVLTQPPAMEEMSPYRRVHAPHAVGYFNTIEMRYALVPLASGGTRLTLSATHVLRIDPALYWEPLARLAISMNEARVLRDLKAKAER